MIGAFIFFKLHAQKDWTPVTALPAATQVAFCKLQDEMSKLFLILENTYIMGSKNVVKSKIRHSNFNRFV